MRFTIAAFAVTAFTSSALAHVEMIDPAPFRSNANKLIDKGTVDFDMNAPLKPNGSDFPCKGFVDDFKQSPAGDPTATWAAGSPQTVTLLGEATHLGGSCQLSLSYDGGKTFRVIKSIEGDCPNSGLKLDFNVPADAKQGKAIFAWSWNNHTGNREMYMNCAAVDITGSGTSTLDDRPEIFIANIGGQCKTLDEKDVQYPDPGPVLQVLKSTDLAPPDCGPDGSSPPPPPEGSDTNPDSTDTTPDSTDPTYSTKPAVPTESEPTPTDTPVLSDTPVPSSTSSAPASTSTNTSGIGPSYTVKAGDICMNIAAQQGISLADLFRLNPKVNKECTNLIPGDVLTLRRRSRIMRDLY
jgi:LysM repeat protein